MKPEIPTSAETTENPGYWRGKKPCWILLGCPPAARAKCDAYQHPEIPCWEHHATLCEEVLRIPRDCQLCIVYKAYHYQDPFDESAYPS